MYVIKPVIFNFLVIVVRMDGSVICQGPDFKGLIEVASLTESIPQGQSEPTPTMTFTVLPQSNIQTLTVLGWQVSIVVPILEAKVYGCLITKLSM